MVSEFSSIMKDDQMKEAIRGRDINCVNSLLDDGVDINHKSEITGRTYLMFACYAGNVDMVELLLDRGSLVNDKSNFGATALMSLGNKNPVSMLITLLTRGADVSIRTSSGLLCFDYYPVVWKDETAQELIINKQLHNIKLLDDKVGVLPSLKIKYKEIIELGLLDLIIF